MKSKIDNFYKIKLKNGPIILFEKRNMPIICSAASVKFGSGYETKQNKGIAHFIEHMLFKGTKRKSYKEISREIEKKGGILNGYTSEENTAFWNKMPSNYVELSLANPLELFFEPVFDKKEFEKERRVILEEIKMYKDNPVYYVRDKIKEMLYKEPFGISALGREKNILNFKRKNLIEIHKKYYNPANLIISVVGKARIEDIIEIVKNKIKTKRNIKPIFKSATRINKHVVEKRKGIEQAHFMLGFHTPTILDNKRYSYEFIMTYLTSGLSSRIYEEIREKRGLAYSVKGDVDEGRNYSYASIYVGTKKEAIKKVKELILRELKNVKNIKKKEFEETKEQMIGMRKLISEESENVMNYLLLEELGKGAEEFYKYEEKVSNLKLKDIKNFKLKNFSTFTLIPD